MDNLDAPPTVNSLTSTALDRISDLTSETIGYIEENTRRAPLQSIACAVTAGYLLRQIPLFSLLGALFRLALVLVRPAALIFGGVKICQYLAETAPFKPADHS